MGYEIDSVLISEEELKQKVKELGAAMMQDLQNESIVFIVGLSSKLNYERSLKLNTFTNVFLCKN